MSRPLLLALLLIVATPLHAADEPLMPGSEPPVPDSVRAGEPWSEGSTELPPWPADADLIPFQIDGTGGLFRYAIDGRNLVVGDDEVVRYTLIAESASGARNVSFEGIRCTPQGHYRIYAYGAAGRFSAVTGSEWLPVEKDGGSTYRDDLWRTYFCVPLKFAPRPRADILRALRRGRVSHLEGTGFMTD